MIRIAHWLAQKKRRPKGGVERMLR